MQSRPTERLSVGEGSECRHHSTGLTHETRDDRRISRVLSVPHPFQEHTTFFYTPHGRDCLNGRSHHGFIVSDGSPRASKALKRTTSTLSPLVSGNSRPPSMGFRAAVASPLSASGNNFLENDTQCTHTTESHICSARAHRMFSLPFTHRSATHAPLQYAPLIRLVRTVRKTQHSSHTPSVPCRSPRRRATTVKNRHDKISAFTCT